MENHFKSHVNISHIQFDHFVSCKGIKLHACNSPSIATCSKHFSGPTPGLIITEFPTILDTVVLCYTTNTHIRECGGGRKPQSGRRNHCLQIDMVNGLNGGLLNSKCHRMYHTVEKFGEFSKSSVIHQT